MSKPLHPVRELIQTLGDARTIAPKLGLERTTVNWWKIRERVPAEHWPALIRLANEMNAAGVDIDFLERISTRRKQRGVA